MAISGCECQWRLVNWDFPQIYIPTNADPADYKKKRQVCVPTTDGKTCIQQRPGKVTKF